MSKSLGKTSRRAVLGGALATVATTFGAGYGWAASQFGTELRGSIDIAYSGLIPGADDDQSRLLQEVLDHASSTGKPVLLPAGSYRVSNIMLPRNTTMIGVPGATRLIYTGGGHLLMCENAKDIRLTGLTLDAANRPIAEYAGAALRITDAANVSIDDCRVVGSLAAGIRIDRSGGRIERTGVTGALGSCAIHLVETRNFAIVDNELSDCANGGIRVHRWNTGGDGTIISGNRIFNIAAVDGIDDDNGTGIGIFRANSALVSNNRISDCANSAISAGETGNIQIVANQCRQSAGTAIHVKNGYTGAVIASNVVDGGRCGISISRAISGARMAICSDNLVRNIHGNGSENAHNAGAGITAEHDTTINGNIVESAERFGLMLGAGGELRNIVATSNIISSVPTGIYVSVAAGAKNTVISGNVISGASGGAIIGYEGENPVTRDMGSGNNFGYDHLTLERNRVG
jgi:uncharacterized secreted repeat protein (TIGR03808 family)